MAPASGPLNFARGQNRRRPEAVRVEEKAKTSTTKVTKEHKAHQGLRDLCASFVIFAFPLFPYSLLPTRYSLRFHARLRGARPLIVACAQQQEHADRCAY